MQQHGKGSSLASRQQLFSLVSFGPSSDEGPVSSLPFSPPLPWRCSYCSSVSCSPLWNASSVSVFKRNVKPGPTLPTWTFDFYDLDICFAVGFVTLDTFLSQARIAKNRKTWFSLFRICSITAGTRQEHTGPNAETSETFGETQMNSGTNLFGVFSCVGSFWNRVTDVWPDSTCRVWECRQSEDWTPSDTLISCLLAVKLPFWLAVC